jgi:hypothetical protein
MTPIIGILTFGIGVATLIVPAGAQLIGRLIELLGIALQRHGEALAAAWRAYRAEIGGTHWYFPESAGWTAEGIAEQERRAQSRVAHFTCESCGGTGLK